jgi:2,4-dienoyl-CoA reductase-like NADH-dependent reductase (Old Yellow Enzyme family)
MNPNSNTRTDSYGGSLENRSCLLREIISSIHAACGPGFAVSVKLNSEDFQAGGSTEAENLEVLGMLEKERVDLVQISGGSYEAPATFGTHENKQIRESTTKREAYFLGFAEEARKSLKVPLMVTGGFRTRDAMNAAIAWGATDLIGMARPLCLEPELPLRLLTSTDPDCAATKPEIDWRALPKSEATFESFWHTMQIQRMGEGMEPEPGMKPSQAAGVLFRNLSHVRAGDWIGDEVHLVGCFGKVRAQVRND